MNHKVLTDRLKVVELQVTAVVVVVAAIVAVGIPRLLLMRSHCLVAVRRERPLCFPEEDRLKIVELQLTVSPVVVDVVVVVAVVAVVVVAAVPWSVRQADKNRLEIVE